MDFFVGVTISFVVRFVSTLFVRSIGLWLACSAGTLCTLCTLATGALTAFAAGFGESHPHEDGNQKYEASHIYFLHITSRKSHLRLA